MRHDVKHPQPCQRPSPTLLALGVAAALAFANAGAQPYVMPTGTMGYHDPKDKTVAYPWDEDPAADGSFTKQVLRYGKDDDGNTIPKKTIRIYNNTDQMVYPIMRDPNSALIDAKATPKVGLYDPYDPADMEYRGYIGYKQGDDYYFGLKPKESIIVSIPLVFWNGARIGIGTDGAYLTPIAKPNPLGYDANAVRSIAPAEKGNDVTKDGVVMWYRAGISLAPNDDTEDQLAEWTIRDHEYLVKTRNKNVIPDTELVTLINYDVSNVDNLYLPLAMEVTDAWVLPQVSGTGDNPNREGRWTAGSKDEPNGWTGSITDIDSLQKKIRVFTAAGDENKPNEDLGMYFNGKGWPRYNLPNPKNDPDAPIKIPSGANIFAQSPLKATPSSYGDGTWQNDKYMLTSGGADPISTTIGWSGTKSAQVGDYVVTLDFNDKESATKMAFIKKGYAVEGRPPEPNGVADPNPISPGTLVDEVYPDKFAVKLTQPLIYKSEASAFRFIRPTSDYASEAMIKLWFSWADYYIKNYTKKKLNALTSQTSVDGTIQPGTATLVFEEPQKNLVPGMAVKGDGLDDAETEVGKHTGDAVILKISSDEKSVILSQIASKTGGAKASYTILPPQELHWKPKPGEPGDPLITFNFTKIDEWRDPYEFSQAVYLIMASMNQIGEKNNNNVSKYMQDIVGANMGFIFDPAAKASDDGKMVTSMIRDMIKSVLRGVSDFTKYPDIMDGKKHVYWYPAPSEETGNQKFNVFNLDPFVWFVHVRLGFSGYGFSVDDDTADIGAGGANNLVLTVSGSKGLDNLNVWSMQAPFGPVTVDAYYSGTATDTLYSSIKGVSSTTPIKITTQAAHHLSEDAEVKIDQVVGVDAANGTFTIKNVTRDSFDLYKDGNAVAGTGTYTSDPTPGRWSFSPEVPYIETGTDLSKVFYRVTGDDALGTFQGTPIVKVEQNGVELKVVGGEKGKEKIRVWQLGKQKTGQLLLNTKIVKADGSTTPLTSGTYAFTFSGESH